MKKILIVFAISLFLSCGKETTFLPEETVLNKEQLQAQHQQYYERLVANEEGWFLNIAGEESKDSVMLHLIFKADNSVLIKSTTRENMNLATSQFRIDGDYQSLLKFEGTSIFSLMQYKEHAPEQFIIADFKDNSVYLTRADGYNDKIALLTPFNITQNQLFLAKQDSVYDLLEYEEAFAITKGLFLDMLLEDFDKGADKKRFKVFNIGNYGFHWTNVDTITSKMTFEFVPPYNPVNPSYIKYQQTYSYEFFPGGIAFQPAITYGMLEIDKILFDTYDHDAKQLLVTEAGNVTEPVTFGYSNQEAFYYDGITKIFDVTAWTANAYRFAAATSATNSFKGRFNDIVANSRSTLRSNGTLIPAATNISFSVRINNSGSGGGSMIQIYIPPLADIGNITFKCDYELVDKNRVKVKNLAMTPAAVNANYNVTATRQLIYDIFCGESGFYISPLSASSFYMLDPDYADDFLVLDISTNAANADMITYFQQYTR